MKRTISVLLAADNPEEVFLTRRAFRLCDLPTIIDVVTDAQEMMDYFDGKERFANRSIFPLPELAVLDMKEVECALDLLKRLKEHSGFEAIPVAIVSAVEIPRIITKAYALGAVAYLSKPLDSGALQRLLKAVYAVVGPRQRVTAAN